MELCRAGIGYQTRTWNFALALPLVPLVQQVPDFTLARPLVAGAAPLAVSGDGGRSLEIEQGVRWGPD